MMVKECAYCLKELHNRHGGRAGERCKRHAKMRLKKWRVLRNQLHSRSNYINDHLEKRRAKYRDLPWYLQPDFPPVEME